jgi:hypothetical protein
VARRGNFDEAWQLRCETFAKVSGHIAQLIDLAAKEGKVFAIPARAGSQHCPRWLRALSASTALDQRALGNSASSAEASTSTLGLGPSEICSRSSAPDLSRKSG